MKRNKGVRPFSLIRQDTEIDPIGNYCKLFKTGQQCRFCHVFDYPVLTPLCEHYHYSLETINTKGIKRLAQCISDEEYFNESDRH